MIFHSISILRGYHGSIFCFFGNRCCSLKDGAAKFLRRIIGGYSQLMIQLRNSFWFDIFGWLGPFFNLWLLCWLLSFRPKSSFGPRPPIQEILLTTVQTAFSTTWFLAELRRVLLPDWHLLPSFLLNQHLTIISISVIYLLSIAVILQKHLSRLISLNIGACSLLSLWYSHWVI